MSLQLDAEAIAAQTCSNNSAISIPQTRHRITIASHFDLRPGQKILEVGCGQGDFTVVLAAAVGDNGHVTAVDPGALDYGSPATLGQAQAHISKQPLGPRITWVQADPIAYLSSLPEPKTASEFPFDLTVFANSLWYFASPTQIASTLAIAAKYSKRVAISEYALYAAPSAGIAALPHMYAVFAQAALEVRKTAEHSLSNIRTLVSPRAIKSLAETGKPSSSSKAESAVVPKLKLVSEGTFTPDPVVQDAMWEVGHVRSEGFLAEIEEVIKDEREKELVMSLRDAVIAARDDLETPEGRTKPRMMDVWVGVFESI